MTNNDLIGKYFNRIEKPVEFDDAKLLVWVNPNMEKDLGWKETWVDPLPDDATPEQIAENKLHAAKLDAEFGERAVQIVYSFSDETMARIREYQYVGVLWDKFIAARDEYFGNLRKKKSS